MSDVNELAALSHAGLFLKVNPNRGVYQSVEDWLKDHKGDDIEPDMQREMIARNMIVRIQSYVITPVGFVLIHHYDVDAAIAIAIECARDYDK